jgi:hypothetical protein
MKQKMRGALPSLNKKPNKHRMGAWQPPLRYPRDENGNKPSRQDRSNMLKYYNAQLLKAKRGEI